MATEFWNRKTFCIVTGASRGIGRAITIQFAQKVLPGSTFLLLARSVKGLAETKIQVLNVAPKVNMVTVPIDFSSNQVHDRYTSVISDCLHLTNQVPNDFGHSIIVHNAGSVGEREYINNLPHLKDPNLLTDYFRMNLLSVMTLNDQFLKIVTPAVPSRTVVNLSSVAASGPLPAAMLYCTGKSAREMFFRCLALELPDLNVLNYSPGPVDTDMRVAFSNKNVPPAQRGFYNPGVVLSPDMTALKLSEVLSGQKYKSGDRVDYFD